MLKKLLMLTLLLMTTSVCAAGSLEDCGTEAKACLQYGASVYQDRCALCHGTDGLGEGIMPMMLKNYPSTNLLDNKKQRSATDIKRIITYGSSLPEISTEMPPWGDELTHTQLESVSEFVAFMRKDLQSALPMLKKADALKQPSIKLGRGVFLGRCSLCHGQYGLGDGKMSRIIKDPPPFNLTLSRQPDDYLQQLISKGGKEMGRSKRMPPFGGDLSDTELKSVIMYIKTLRTN